MGHVWSRLHNRHSHPLRALELCGSLLVTQVCFYMCYTCALVGSPKYVQSISQWYLTQSQLASGTKGDPRHLPTVHPSSPPPFTFVLELWLIPIHLNLKFEVGQHFNGNKTSVFPSHIRHSFTPQVCLSSCILGTVVEEFTLCPPACQRKPAIVKTAVCVFVNKLRDLASLIPLQ